MVLLLLSGLVLNRFRNVRGPDLVVACKIGNRPR